MLGYPRPFVRDLCPACGIYARLFLGPPISPDTPRPFFRVSEMSGSLHPFPGSMPRATSEGLRPLWAVREILPAPRRIHARPFVLPPRPAHARPAPVSFSSVPCVVSFSMGDCTKRNFGPFYRVRNVRILCGFVQIPGSLGSSYALSMVADNMPVSFPDTENSRALFLWAYISGYSLRQRSQRRPRPQIAAFLLWSIKYASVLVSPRKGAFCAHRAAPVPLLASVPLGLFATY